AAGSLAGKTLPLGGSWSGAGSATDFTLDTVYHTAKRTLTGETQWSGRFAIAGTTVFTSSLIQVDVQTSHLSGNTNTAGVIARYTDTNNWLAFLITSD